MPVIFGNYGDNTIALIQWAHEKGKQKVIVVHVDTGWSAQNWQRRVEIGQALAKQYAFEVVSLAANPTFSEMVRDRRRFPSVKFQWCAGFLKGLPFLKWLDSTDFNGEQEIWLGSRRADSRARSQLPLVIEASEHYAGRKLVYPLCHYNNTARDALLQRAGVKALGHRSLECDPCIHCRPADLYRLEQEDVDKTAALESEIEQSMFNFANLSKQMDIRSLVRLARQMPTSQNSHYLETFDMGCGAPYGCGE